MAIYTGADKRIGRVFKQIFSTTEQLIGKWIDGNDLYEKSYSVSIANATSSAEVLADLSGLGFDYCEIVRANLVTASGRVPIFGNLEINGTNVEYTAEVGTGPAYFTLHYTKSS